MTWQKKLVISVGWVVIGFGLQFIYAVIILSINHNVSFLTDNTSSQSLDRAIFIGESIFTIAPIIMIILVWFSKPKSLYRKLNLIN